MNSRSLLFGLLVCVQCTAVAFGQAPRGSFSDSDARAIEIGRAYLKYQQQLRETLPPPEGERWWRTSLTAHSTNARDKNMQAAREFHDAVRAALGAEPIRAGGRDQRFTFLPEAKQEQVARIEQSYTDRVADIRREFGMARLPADAQRLTQAAADRDRELAAVLTAAEREMLDLRTSASAMTLRQRYGELIESEEEFRRFYALQKAFDEKFSPEEMMFSAKPADVYRLRAEAEHKLLADMGEVVGESRAKAVRYAVDQDYIMISTLCRRLNLPSKAAEEVMRIRENYATQSLVVNNESGVNFNDRRALIQELHKEAQKELAGVLGKEGMDAYGPRSTWLRYLESGMAYSTDAKDSRSTGSIGSPSMGVYYVSSMTSVRPPSPSAAPSSGTGSTAPASATTPAGAKRSKTPPVSGRSDEKSAPVSPPATEPAASPAK